MRKALGYSRSRIYCQEVVNASLVEIFLPRLGAPWQSLFMADDAAQFFTWFMGAHLPH